MEDQQLGRLLRELPRERAGDPFTARVLANLDGEPERRTRQARPAAWALATAAVLALLVSAVLVDRRDLWRGGHPNPETREARQALEEIRDEHERLARELERLQSLRAGQEWNDAEAEVIYLGGNESFDLVLDPDSVPEGATLPASYEPETF